MVGIILLSQISLSHYSPLKKLFSVHWPRFVLFMSKILSKCYAANWRDSKLFWACSFLKIQEAFCGDQQQLVTWIITVLCVNWLEKTFYQSNAMFSTIIRDGYWTYEAFCIIKAGLMLPLICWKFKKMIGKLHVFEKNQRVFACEVH